MHFFSKESRSAHFACCYAISLLKLHKYQCKDKSTLKEMLVSYLMISAFEPNCHVDYLPDQQSDQPH